MVVMVAITMDIVVVAVEMLFIIVMVVVRLIEDNIVLIQSIFIRLYF
jgi:hypothetical protein